MLIDFEVGNYRSFRKPVRFSMVAANADKEFLEENTFKTARIRLLKSAVLYGANASGKSNLLNAMAFMRLFVLNSSKETQVKEEIQVIPFKLDYVSENEPSHFEANFLQGGKRFRYGFTVTRKAVVKEWLFRAEKNKEYPLFLRDGKDIEVCDGFDEGKDLEAKTRENALFLSVTAQFNGAISGSILKWFFGFRTLSGLGDKTYDRIYENITAEMFKDEHMKSLLLELIKQADVGIGDMSVSEINVNLEQSQRALTPHLLNRPKRFRISTVHQKFRDGIHDGFVDMDFLTEESEGTKKLFRIAGPMLFCLIKGYIMFIDELDAKLHPLLTRAVVKMFNSPISNRKNAQLIFSTHDTNLLHYGKLRRDQIWFTEKNNQAETDLYSLVEFKLKGGAKVRKDADFESNYVKGRYGAVPFLGDLGKLLKEINGAPSRKTE